MSLLLLTLNAQSLLMKFLCSRPELKPVEKEVEVILRFPEVEPIAPPAIQLDEMSFGYILL